MNIITSGSSYIDIDAYGGCIAYAELLNLMGEQAVAVSTAPWNESISPTVRSWGGTLLTKYRPGHEDTFALIDVSDPTFFDPIVDVARVAEVIDHHVGFEEHWKDQIGSKSHIEFIGAAATLVFERWQQANKLPEMSQHSARLLLTAILDNTLNFGAGVTTKRDHEAYKNLLPVAQLSRDWPAQYFQECEQSIVRDLVQAIQNDTKTLHFESLSGPTAFGQLIVWNGQKFLDKHALVMEHTLASMGNQWLINIIALQQGRSYFFARQKAVQEMLTPLLDTLFVDDIAKTARMWLRKEVLKAASSA